MVCTDSVFVRAETINLLDINSYNSQNMNLLQSGFMPLNGVGSTGGGDISIVDDVALSSDGAIFSFNAELNKSRNYGKISIYTVREGDTLSQIAQMFDVSINTIRWANNFSGPIKPGQELIILPVTGVTHVVKSGGTIEDVAKIYNADINEIALFNGIDVGKKLAVGEKIIVPNVDPVPKEESRPYSSTIGSSGSQFSAPSKYYRNPVFGAILTQGIHGYNAVDFGAPIGTPIIASASGKVITSKQGGWNGGYGSMIIISHPNGTQTLYSHLSKNVVISGQNVSAGDVIGYIGSTGRSTGPHLHFEIRGAKNPFSSCRVGSVCKI